MQRGDDIMKKIFFLMLITLSIFLISCSKKPKYVGITKVMSTDYCTNGCELSLEMISNEEINDVCVLSDIASKYEFTFDKPTYTRINDTEETITNMVELEFKFYSPVELNSLSFKVNDSVKEFDIGVYKCMGEIEDTVHSLSKNILVVNQIKNLSSDVYNTNNTNISLEFINPTDQEITITDAINHSDYTTLLKRHNVGTKLKPNEKLVFYDIYPQEVNAIVKSLVEVRYITNGEEIKDVITIDFKNNLLNVLSQDEISYAS